MASMQEELTKTNTKKMLGKALANVKGATPQEIWCFLEDFCNFHKWLPSLDTSYQVGEGVYGQPGLIRHCVSTVGEGDQAFTKWAREKLLVMDPIERCLTYEIIDNNIGFKSYIGTWKVMESEDGEGCQIEWSFVSDEIEGWEYEDFLSYAEFSLKGVVEKMEKAALESTCN